jgi:hypothetical protein
VTSRGPAICDSCIHLERPSPYGETPRCTAFSTGIPPEIYYEGEDHREPKPGDDGIQWDLMPGMEWALTIYEGMKQNDST